MARAAQWGVGEHDRPAVGESNSVWAAAEGGAQAANAAIRSGRGIFVKGHEIALGQKHTSLRFAPINQNVWRAKRPTAFIDDPTDDIHNTDAFGNSFATLGAGSHQFGGISCGGHLRSDINRERGVNLPPASPEELERVFYSPLLEDASIQALFELDSHYPDDLQYECSPDDSEP